MKEPVLLAFLWDMNPYQLMLMGVKIVAAVVGGIMGWFAGGILGVVLYKVAFHSKMPAYGQLIAKTVGAAILGVLAFFLVNFGLGGGVGFGPGGGGAPNSNDGPAKVAKGPEKEDEKKNLAGDLKKEEVQNLIVEMIPWEVHDENPTDKIYAVRGEDGYRNIKDLEDYLNDNKAKPFRVLEFRVYKDSKDPFTGNLAELRSLADRADPKLQFEYPQKWREINRPVEK
ncbi:MAG: hypothetical protein ACFCD0_03330 [Gemmataceae bacterium]